MMAEQVVFRHTDISLQADEGAVRFYPSLYSKVKQHNDEKNVISLCNVSVDALEILVDWIKRRGHYVEHAEFDQPGNLAMVKLSKDYKKSLRSVDRKVIFEIVQIADEYDMMDLLDGACQIAAPIIENMNPFEVKATFFASDNSSGEEEGFLNDDSEL